MPVLAPVVHHPGVGADGRPDSAFVDEPTAGLDARTQHGVGGGAQPQALLGGKPDLGQPLLPVHPQGFLGVGVLAGLEGGHVDLVVHVGGRQVQDDLDFGVRQDLLVGDGPRPPMLRCPLRRPLGDDVRDGDDLQNLEALVGGDVDSADVPATDDANFDLVHPDEPPHIRRSGQVNASAAARPSPTQDSRDVI